MGCPFCLPPGILLCSFPPPHRSLPSTPVSLGPAFAPSQEHAIPQTFIFFFQNQTPVGISFALNILCRPLHIASSVPVLGFLKFILQRVSPAVCPHTYSFHFTYFNPSLAYHLSHLTECKLRKGRRDGQPPISHLTRQRWTPHLPLAQGQRRPFLGGWTDG